MGTARISLKSALDERGASCIAVMCVALVGSTWYVLLPISAPLTCVRLRA